ncbi:VWA domain-containing protein [Thermosphaera chiliense]|uniref:VWA domain-containing protein n=1 Tax=Thermosphaera chiliense TaxID=3402707 RepID=A0A7M1URY0_9CREN|nr:VWA domain-containing protein [Thermosphaera aggregans]QOR94729.1 VWA domain-containing protein [Thermosphaera aggregans]
MKSYGEESPEALKKEFSRRIEDWIREAFKGAGATGVSVDRIILYVKLGLTLEGLLRSREQLEQYKDLLRGALGLKPVEKTGEEVLASFSLDQSFQARLSRSRTVRVSDLLSKDSTPQQVLEYIWYRKTGVIRRSRNGGFVVDAERLRSMGARGSITVKDLNKYLGEVPSQLWGKIVSSSVLERMSRDEIVEFASRFYGRNPGVDKRIDHEIASRLNAGWRPSLNEYRRIERVVSRVSPRLKASALLPYMLPQVDSSFLSRDDMSRLAKRLEELSLRDRWRIIDKIYKNPGYEPLLSQLGVFSLAGIGNPDRLGEPLRSKTILGQSLMNYVAYLLTRDPSYLDYSMYLASRVNPEALEPGLRRLHEGLQAGDSRRLITIIARQDPAEALEALSYKLWEYVSTRGRLEVEPSMLRRAVEIGCMILNRAWARRGVSAEWRVSARRGRVDVRKTMFKHVRMDETIVYRRRERRVRVVGVVDVSGSMSRFSLWSILSLASLTPVLSGVVMFSEKPVIYRAPGAKTQRLLVNYLENLFQQGFKGYTNISSALREAYRLSLKTGSGRIVLFTDLQQTVQDVDPWVEAAGITGKGVKVVVITPSQADERVVELMRSAGCLVEVVSSPEKIPKILKRKLNV